jgi:hypothetical protein
MKIALYKNTGFDFEAVFIIRNDENVDGYVRISEFVEMDFPMLPKDVFTQQMMAAFDDEEKKARIRLADALSAINQRRQEFMAISHQEAE